MEDSTLEKVKSVRLSTNSSFHLCSRGKQELIWKKRFRIVQTFALIKVLCYRFLTGNVRVYFQERHKGAKTIDSKKLAGHEYDDRKILELLENAEEEKSCSILKLYG